MATILKIRYDIDTKRFPTRYGVLLTDCASWLSC